VDVSECAFVIRFNPLATTKAHIQGSGRARHSNARIYYFENDPDRERQKEGFMTSVARDASLQLSGAALTKSSTLMNVAVRDRHPYPFGSRHRDSLSSFSSPSPPLSGEANVYNSKQILNQYCSVTLGQSISPKTHLYKYETPTTPTLGLFGQKQSQGRKVLASVRYPTPSGWCFKTSADYKSFWSGVDTDVVFGEEERIKKKTASEREEMMFAYVVVVELRKKEFLDSHNKARTDDADFRFQIKRNCPVQQQSSFANEISWKSNRVY
jgi:hypothetical protein